jgi:hypothetical protein
MTRLAALPLLTFALYAAPVRADVSPEDIWRVLDAIPGVSAIASRKPDGLVLSNVTIAIPETPKPENLVLSLDTLILTRSGDGAVEVTAAPDIRLTWIEADQSRLSGTIAIPGARAFVSGSLEPGQLWIDSAFPTITPDLTETGPGATDRATITGTVTDLTAALARPSADDGLASMSLTIGSGDLSLKGTSANEALDAVLRLAGFNATLRLSPGYLTDPPLMPAGRVVLSLASDSFEVDASSPDIREFSNLVLSLSGLSARSAIDIGAEPADKSFPGASMTGDLSMSAATFLFEPGQAAAQDGTAGSLRARQSDITLAGRIVVPPGMENADLTPALTAGMAVDLRAGFGAGSSEADLPIPDFGNVATASTGTSASVTLSMSRSGFLFDVTQMGTAVRATVPGQPEPFEGKLGEVVLRMAGPLVRSAAAQPFELVLRLADATASDGVWALFDPQSTIPRDPATVSLRLTGKGEVMGDLLAQDRAPDDVPFHPRRIDLTELILSAGGARVAGSGALDFADRATVPPPTGQVNMTWKGVYALLDKLTALGLVPQDAGLGIRGGLGMIARPVGPDDLTTTFEFRDGGKVLANGAPLPGFD